MRVIWVLLGTTCWDSSDSWVVADTLDPLGCEDTDWSCVNALAGRRDYW
jgi:hypothetical protein